MLDPILSDPTDNDKRETDLDFVRSSGECVCGHCGQLFRKHPHAREILGYDDLPFLRRLCNGKLVKL